LTNRRILGLTHFQSFRGKGEIDWKLAELHFPIVQIKPWRRQGQDIFRRVQGPTVDTGWNSSIFCESPSSALNFMTCSLRYHSCCFALYPSKRKVQFMLNRDHVGHVRWLLALWSRNQRHANHGMQDNAKDAYDLQESTSTQTNMNMPCLALRLPLADKKISLPILRALACILHALLCDLPMFQP
jgi:hypothetical protein